MARRIIRAHVKPNNEVHTDEYSIYTRLGRSYRHRSVNHSAGEYIKDGVSVNGAEYANQRFKEFHINKRRVSKKYLDGYSDLATIWVNTTTMMLKGSKRLILEAYILASNRDIQKPKNGLARFHYTSPNIFESREEIEIYIIYIII